MTREKMFQTMVRGLSECVDHAREKGIIISTEILESVSVPWSSLGEMKRVLEEVPGLMYTHDTGNPLVPNEDPAALCGAFWDKVVSVHFKDLGYTDETENTYRTMDGRHLRLVPPGTGAVNFAEHLKLFAQRS